MSDAWKQLFEIDVNLHLHVERSHNAPLSLGEARSWVWSATSFMGTRDICSRGYRSTEADARAAANKAGTLILQLRLMEREGT